MEDTDFEKEIRAVRKQGFVWGSYTTPVEISHKAADYLIAHAGQPLDFDDFHKKFKIKRDKGGLIFPYDTLNWHTYLSMANKSRVQLQTILCKDLSRGIMDWKEALYFGR